MAETAQYDPVVVEPRLTELKVQELVSFQRESAKLDYKVALNVSDTKQKVELAKDLMAMANTAGGYLVIGIDNSGALVGSDEGAAARIDEATIRSQLAGYTSARIPLFVDNRVTYKDRRLVVITVLPVTGTIVVAEADGNIADGRALFRKGDVLVRHGSASERWNQADVDFLLRRVVSVRKEEWLRDFGADMRYLLGSSSGATPSVGAEAFDLAPADFQKVVTDLLRSQNG